MTNDPPRKLSSAFWFWLIVVFALDIPIFWCAYALWNIIGRAMGFQM